MLKTLFAWINDRFPVISLWKRFAVDYYVPKNLNGWYCFGVLGLLILINQLLSGLWLTMFYTPTITQAFDSIQGLMRDVYDGWLLRYLHTTGASAFFLVMYLHLFRGLIYGSYQKPRELVWLIGMVLMILFMAEAFFGYLLPWGQMSYWGAQVITSLLSAVPVVGESLVTWLRGDYVVSQVTLQRFFALHIIAVPLLLIFFVWCHIMALHHVGSNNPDGIDVARCRDELGHPRDAIPFHPYYTLKDAWFGLLFLIVFFTVVFYCPDGGGLFIEPNNALPANPLLTPSQIKPMWYLAPFYSMLRAIPSKLGGIVAFVGALGILCGLPWLDRSPVRSIRYKGSWSRFALASWCISFVVLGYLGMLPETSIRLGLARICVVIYFAFFILMPWYTQFERTKVVPARVGLS